MCFFRQDKLIKGALFSDCKLYRYNLWRIWDKEKAHVMFIGLNPSTADEFNDDPTIRRCISFAKSWGYGGIYMTNLFAFRATNPNNMKIANDPVGKLNNLCLMDHFAQSKITIACWGIHGIYKDRDKEVKKLIPKMMCLGKTKDGHPKHPLYLKKDLRPVKL